MEDNEEDATVLWQFVQLLDSKPERKYWVHPINEKRDIKSVLDELKSDPAKFYNYCRMSENTFYHLLGLIGCKIQRRDTNFRRCISAEEREMARRIETQELLLKLHCWESPFSWTLPAIEKNNVDSFLLYCSDKYETMNEMNEGENLTFKWRSFSVSLLLGFEFWDKLGDIVSARNYISLCAKEVERFGDGDSGLACSRGLWHVLKASEAALLLHNRDMDQAKNTIDILEDLNNLSEQEKAGVYGVKAAVFSLYKPAGLQQALECAISARDMDPGEAEWHYLVAYCIGKMRKDDDPVSHLEIDEIEHACRLKTNATYIVHLAQVYADYSKFVHRNRHNPSVCCSPNDGLNRSTDYAKKAVLKLREGLLLNPRCPRLKVKGASCLLTIPEKKDTDADWAADLLKEVVSLVPRNPSAHFCMGKFYDKFGKDPMMAIDSLTKAHKLGSYPAFIYLVTLKWKYSMDSTLIADLTEALKQYTAESENAELFVYLGVAYLLLEDNWTTAVQCFVNSLELNPLASQIENFYGFYWKNKNANLLEVVTNELRIKTKENYASMKTIFHVFLEKIIAINQKLFTKSPVTGLYSKFRDWQLKTRIKL